MTDFDAATVRHGIKSLATVAFIALLGGCAGGGESLFGGGPTASVDQSAVQTASAPKPLLGKVALTPVVGAPDAVARQIAAQLTQSGERNRIAILNDREANADYVVRGYIVAARDKAGTKVSYIWDVSDQSGKRVNRISGEELAAGQPNPKDAWANVTAALTQTIADKTAASLSQWLATQPAPSAAPVASAAPQQIAPALKQPAAGAGAPPPAAETAPRAASPATSPTTTAAISRSDDLAVVVPAVAGAPGDGNGALTAAIQRELSRQGIALVDKPGASYKVEGKVVIGQTKDGKQPIQIDWRVKDPQGKSLGTVSQKNEILPGSLDAEWGKTAEAAAAAAAQGIVKLLPQPRATN